MKADVGKMIGFLASCIYKLANEEPLSLEEQLNLKALELSFYDEADR